MILDNCDIGRRAKIRRAILDKNVRVPEDAVIGYDLERDRAPPPRHRKRHRGGGRRPHAGGYHRPGRVLHARLGRGAPAEPHGTAGPGLDHAVWVPGDLPAARVRHRRAAGARRDPAHLHRLPGLQGHLSLPLAFAAALAGSICGITISYWLGRTFGLALIHRYGRYLRITEEHVNKAHAWFERVGHWGLTFGYFVPGVRHLTAYAAGMSDLEPHQFALFAYSGAVPVGHHLHRPRLFPRRALGGRRAEHPPLPARRHHRRGYSAGCVAGVAEAAGREIQLIASAVATTTTQPITLYQRYETCR